MDESLEKKYEFEKFRLEAPEGGWGYVLSIAMAVMFIVTVGPLAAFGIIYGKFLASLGDESSNTTIVSCMFNTVICFMGLIANQMLQKYSCRFVGILGSIIFFWGNFLTAFAVSLVQIVFTFGILQGMGFGLMLPATFSAFNRYFVVRKNFVMGISQTLVAAACMGLPYLCRSLMDNYGYRGTVVILSAISLHGFLAMITLQPVEWHLKKVPITSIELSFLPQENISIPEKNGHPDKEIPYKKYSFLQGVLDFLEVDLLKDITYVNLSIGLSLSFLSDIMFLTLLPAFLDHMGYNKMDIAFFVTVYMVADLLGRVFLSCFTAFFTVKNRLLFLIGTTLVTLIRIAMSIISGGWSWIFFVCASLGLLRCLIQVTIPLVLAEYSETRFTAVFGLYQAICGVMSLIMGPLSGLIASETSNDIWLQHMLTSMLLLCVIPWIVEYLCLYFKNKK